MKIKNSTLRLAVSLWCLVVAMCVTAQVKVAGTVTDNSGDPLPGVTVKLHGNPAVGIATDLDGNFVLSVPSLDATLDFTYIGYQAKSVALKGRSNINVTMSEDSEMLDEVVVVGYGVQKKVSLTGSVSAVSGKDLVKTPMQNVSNMLTGKVSGVTAVQTTGLPGADAATIRVRGLNDFSYSTPMVLVDGVEMDMNLVNPSDIESVSVLKDGASAIYGVRGANGVILITTKKGNREQNARISYSGSVAWVHNTAMPEYLNAEEYMYWHNKAAILDGVTPRYTAEIQDLVLHGNDDPTTPYGQTDWLKETWRTGMINNHNISATGGSQKTTYYVSAGIMDQKGTMRNTDYRRYNLRSNLDISVAKNLRFTSNISGFRTERNWPGVNITNQQDEFNPARQANAALPILKKEYNGYPLAYNNGGGQINPIHILENSGYSRLAVNQILASGMLEYDFKDIHPLLNGLKVSVWANYKYSHSLTGNYSNNPKNYYVNNQFNEPILNTTPGFSQDGTFFRGSSWVSDWMFRPQATYNHKFGKLDVGLLYVYEASKSTGGVFQASAQKFVSLTPMDISMGQETLPSTVSGSHYNDGIVSHVGRLNLDWDGRYLLEAAFRYDSSTNFAPENRWAFFPSVSAAWVISGEKFVKENLPWLDFLKLRLSYAEAGKSNASAFQFQNLFSMSKYGTIMNGNPVALFWTDSYIDRTLKWSTTRTYNIGLDFDVLQRKLGAEIDVFYQHTSDMLQGIQGLLPSSMGGYGPKQANTGQMENRGIDFTLKHTMSVTRDFSYNLRGTFGFARNKVLRMTIADDHPSYRAKLGQPYTANYGLIALGLFQTQEQIDNAPAVPSGVARLGEIMYYDTNGDGKIAYKGTESDFVKIGYGSIPEISFSLNMDFNYRDFSLNLLWQGVSHCDYMLTGPWGANSSNDATPYTRAFYGDGNSPKYLVEDAWTPEHTNARYPRLSTVANGNNNLASTWWKVNGEYLRLKNLSLGYNVPTKVLDHTPLSRVYVYVSGANVLTFSHFKYCDPESPSVSAGHYPQQSTWSLGLDVSF